MTTILKKILMSLLTEKFLKGFIVIALNALAKKTDNKVDDELVALVKKSLNE